MFGYQYGCGFVHLYGAGAVNTVTEILLVLGPLLVLGTSLSH
jgi:hypothetical protein